MSNFPGIGVMLKQLSGNEKEYNNWQLMKGGKITALSLSDDTVCVTLENVGSFKLYDNGQSCCEHRYMVTDDDLTQFVGGRLNDMEIKAADSIKGTNEYDEAHEVQFLRLITDRGNVVFSNHNEHNGYYGGFNITIDKEN